MNASLKKLGLGAFCAALSLVYGTASVQASPLDLSKVPLFMNAAVDPNVILSFDDSGSMLLGIVPNELHESDAMINGVETDTRCWWRDEPWIYSSTANTIFYNPNATYLPPKLADGSSLPNASFEAAYSDGIALHFGDRSVRTRNLNNNFVVTLIGGGSWADPDYIVHGPRQRNCNDESVRIDGARSNNAATRPFPFGDGRAFYYEFIGSDPTDPIQLYTAANYSAVDMTLARAEQKTNFANWYTYYRTRNMMARSAVSHSFDKVGNNIRLAWQGLNNSFINNDFNIRTFATQSHKNAFFDYLLRAPADGGTPTRVASKRIGDYFGDRNTGNDESNPYYDATLNRELSCRQNFHLVVTDGGWKDGRATGVEGNYDQAGLTLPDGRAFDPSSPHTRVYASGPSANAAGYADVGFYYWSTDLRPDLTNNVAPYLRDLSTGVTGPAVTGAVRPLNEPQIYWNPKNDPANWQHLSQYVVAFGLAGELDFPGDLTDLRRGTKVWPNWAERGETDYDGARKTDDTWHSTLNSRGDLLSAKDPAQLTSALNAVFDSISGRGGSISASTVSSGVLADGARAYKTSFDSSDWSGAVQANELDMNGQFGRTLWDASCELTGGPCDSTGGDAGGAPDWNSGRQIITSNSVSGGGVPFRWDSLSRAQQTLLNDNPSTPALDDDGRGSDRLAWVRGDRSREIQNGGNLRNRRSVLGAVVNSGSVYVAAPAAGYRDDFPVGSPEAAAAATAGGAFADFRQTYKNRQPTLYVGANDGMLHAFNAANGEERWAYVPYESFANLNELAEPRAAFVPFVDNTPVARDVFVGGRWRTILVGTLRGGGQGLFALDITNPLATEGGAGTTVLWEFSDNGGAPRLGYTYGRPNIARLHNGEWAVVVSGGYNNEEADGAAGDGRSALFVINAATGRLIREIPLGTTAADSYGLAAPTMGDYDDDYIDEFAVAGDLVGNLWRFDLSSSDPSSWSAEKIFNPATAGTQPITVAPRLFPDPVTQKLTAVFGTGKYLEPADRSLTQSTQSFYGIREDGQGSSDYPIGVGSLTRQTLTAAGTGFRTLSANDVPVASKGWVFDLTETGERNVTTGSAVFSANLAILSTLVPNGDDPCVPGAKGSLIVLDATSGGASDLGPFFDTNNDGQVTAADNAAVASKGVAEFIPSGTPVMSRIGGGAGVVVGLAGIEIRVPKWTRHSWRELFLEQR